MLKSGRNMHSINELSQGRTPNTAQNGGKRGGTSHTQDKADEWHYNLSTTNIH